MNDKQRRDLAKFVEAGDKATENTWHLGHAGTLDDVECNIVCLVPKQTDRDFVRLAANARDAVKAMIAENARLRDALPDAEKLDLLARFMDKIEWTDNPEVQGELRMWAANIRKAQENK